MEWIKITFINAILFFALIGIALLVPPFANTFKNLIYSSELIDVDKRAELDLYEDFDWSDKYFSESSQLSSTYYDSISWRRDDFSGETINITNGIRKTVGGLVDPKKKGFWFFGGSTTWGEGVSDEYTYPSIFSRNNEVKVKNFGDTGYIARQSLSYLTNLIISDEEILSLDNMHVVFYDGVNDVLRCRTEIKTNGTVREGQIQKAFNEKYNKWSFQRTFAQLQDFINKITKNLNLGIFKQKKSEFYDCFNRPEKALEVALQLVNTWEVAAKIVSERGGSFTAVLQPVAYLDTAIIDYLDFDRGAENDVLKEYEVVYQHIRKIASNRDFHFVDLSRVFDFCSECYIDYCHVSPQANQILSKNFSKQFF